MAGASIFAKFVASTVAYPHEVLRTRMQDSRPGYAGLLATAVNMVQREGVWSLWTGLRVNLVRVVPATAATFVTYEYICKHFDLNFGK